MSSGIMNTNLGNVQIDKEVIVIKGIINNLKLG